MSAQARAGVIKEFTGVSDPYEPPEKPELTIATETCRLIEAVNRIIHRLQESGRLGPAG